jgi:hypothetical protein
MSPWTRLHERPYAHSQDYRCKHSLSKHSFSKPLFSYNARSFAICGRHMLQDDSMCVECCEAQVSEVARDSVAIALIQAPEELWLSFCVVACDEIGL